MTDLREFHVVNAQLSNKKSNYGARERLRSVADDSEQRAPQALDPEARGRYHGIAADARRYARLPLGEDGHRLALNEIEHRLIFAAWQDGGEMPAQSVSLFPCVRRGPAAEPLAVEARASIPPTALNARQLAEIVGMSERGARKAIESGFGKGLPGFHHEGRHWYADPSAFVAAKRR